MWVMKPLRRSSVNASGEVSVVVKSWPVIPKIAIVIIVVGTMVFVVSVAASVVACVDILPKSCVKQNVLTHVNNAGSMDISAETRIRMVQSSPTWSALTNRS